MPDNILDVFNDDAFSVVSLTARVNEQPYVPGQVGRLGVFEEDGIDTTTVVVESLSGQLSLIGPTPRGGPGETTPRESRKARSFRVPHFQRDDSVMADEVQGVRAFGQVSQLETVQGKVDQKTAQHTRGLDTTLEHQRVGAIKGIIVDKAGTTMFNLFTEFGIAAPTAVNFALGTADTKVREKCFDVITGIEDALEGETYNEIHALCGNDFWKGLIEHKSVKETYLNTVQASELRGDPTGSQRFEFGGIIWHRYRTGAKAAASNASGAQFIAAGDARFVVSGVPNLFITRFAPADYIETVNTTGLPRYAKQYPMQNGKGVHLEVQSNPISLCTRPGVLYRGTAS